MPRIPAACLSLVACLMLADGAHAALRAPQVPVSGSTLQNLMNAQGQTINVAAEQVDVQGFAGLSVGSPGTLSFTVRPITAAAPALDLYNVVDASPALFQVFPAAALPGWFVAASFRTSPTRLVVNLFDASSASQGSTVYLGVDPFNGTGFAVPAAAGTVFSQDARNADLRAHMLLFHGTGAHSGDAWLAVESGTDFNYSDAVYLLELFAPVPVLRTDWGALKARFR